MQLTSAAGETPPAWWWRCCLSYDPVSESSITLMSLQPQSRDSTATRRARRPTATVCSAKAFITLITHSAEQLLHPSEAPATRLEGRWGGKSSDGPKNWRLSFLCVIINSTLRDLDKLEWWIFPSWIDPNAWSMNERGYFQSELQSSCDWPDSDRRSCFPIVFALLFIVLSLSYPNVFNHNK